jgi:hypothetical protein
MARRTDGTALRYEFQVFDNDQGRAIADHLEQVRQNGESVAAFIRDALSFYIQHGHQAPAATIPANKLQREIEALWQAVQRPGPAAPEPTATEAGSGLDMSPRRRTVRRTGQLIPPSTLPEQAAFDEALARQQLLNSIKAYGQATREAYHRG